MPTETDRLLQNVSQSLSKNSKPFPEPLTFSWRLTHWIHYIIGGSTFAVGSYCYFPWVENYFLGGWLFTIGSLAFAIADFLEWRMNNRVGCYDYAEYEEDFERGVAGIFEPKHTPTGRWQRKVNGVNFFMSFTGSFLYLVGSVYFIPAVANYVLGGYVFIVASVIIVLAQLWKLYRGGNVSLDLSGCLVDFCAGAGAFCYIIGSVLFFPSYNTGPEGEQRAATWFVCGGSLFFLSGGCMCVRYFLEGRF
eukprot:gene32934-39830_t